MSELCSLFPSCFSVPASLPVSNGVMPFPVCKLLGGSVIFSIIARIAFGTLKVNGFFFTLQVYCLPCYAVNG